MDAISPVYLEVVDFIAGGTTPQRVVEFRPSAEAQRRLEDLIEREKAGGLTLNEKAELDHCIELEHILRMAKARARLILGRGR